MINDNLGTLFQSDPSSPPAMALRQGVVQSWNTSTGENSVQVAGGTLVNIPALTGESVALAAGDVVALLTTGDHALVLGKVTTPGDPGTVPSWVGDITALAPLTTLAGVTTGLTITGAVNETSAPATGPRVVINDPAYPGQIVLYTDHPDEIEPARIFPIVSGNVAYMRLVGPKATGMTGVPATLDLTAVTTIPERQIELDATRYHLFGTFTTIDGFSSLKLGDGTDYITIAGQAVTDADLSSPTNTFPANPQPVTVAEGTDLTNQTNTTFAAGTPECGIAFVAPPTGKVYITVSGRIQNQTASNNSHLSYEVRTGATVGSGTVVTGGAAADEKGLSCGTNATGLTFDRLGSSHRRLLTGLTPGSSYNVRTMHRSQNVSGVTVIFDRELLIEPVL